jgi:hypothetical protein
VTAPLPAADALATPGRECMVALCPALDEDAPPPAWEHLIDRCGAERGWRWIAYAEDLSRPAEMTVNDRLIRYSYRVRVYDAAGACVWDTIDNPPPVARVDPPKRPRTELPPKLLAALLAAPERWDEVRALLAGGDR